MSNSIKEKISQLFFKRRLRKYLNPERESFLYSKKIFLAEFDKTNPVTNPLINHVFFTKHVLKYGFFSLLALSAIGGGAVVYADRDDVTPNNPLYAFKKVNESVQVQLASPEEEPALHYKLAQKRITEIKNIQNNSEKDNKSNEEKVKNLSKDFEEEIDNSLSKLDEISGQKADSEAEKKKLCKSIALIIEDHKKTISNYPGFQEDYSGFNKHCSKLLEQNK